MDTETQTPIEALVESLTPGDAAGLLERLMTALARKAAQAAPALDPNMCVVATAPVPASPLTGRTNTPPLPRNMSPETALKKAQERRQHVEAETRTGDRARQSQDAPTLPHQVLAQQTQPPAPPPTPKLKTMAEATGDVARVDEKQVAAVKKAATDGIKTAMYTITPQINDEQHPLPAQQKLGNYAALCPDLLREPQPPGFRPYDMIKNRITGLCQNPTLPNGADILKRFVFDIKDSPTVPVENALLVKFNPVYVLGRHLEASPSKFFVGYIQPSQETTDTALKYLEQVISLWSEGGEFEMGEAPGMAQRSMKTAAGAPVNTGASDKKNMHTAPGVERYQHRPRVFVFKPFDAVSQVAVVIA